METRDDDNWLLLMDPSWEPAGENEAPPLRSVVGLWPVGAGGGVGKFRANPEYLPADESSPSDPLDAVLRMVMRGEGETGQIQSVLREVLVDVAMNGDGRPLVVKSPDDVPCVVLCTSRPHRDRVVAPEWLRTGLDDVVSLLDDGFDVLLNPGGPAAVRLDADFVREASAGDAEPEGPSQAGDELDGVRVSVWEPGEAERAGETSSHPVSQ